MRVSSDLAALTLLVQQTWYHMVKKILDIKDLGLPFTSRRIDHVTQIISNASKEGQSGFERFPPVSCQVNSYRGLF
jgi:hypothetical protein